MPRCPRVLQGKHLLPKDFLKYAMSWGAENLLGVSYQWWHDLGAIKVRYEELVRQPTGALLNLARAFDPGARDENGSIDRFSLPFFQKLPSKHPWHGRPDLC